ncbi:MAG: UDP-3-O-(3-hydroxymyristoyl)glucosamine N-acyltransferase [Gammaproteobacteria bacterium AqS3]|nr:UDP-3-O-(3-hydroxymyristoyl)glucosamine N-acyltransferase [Gammaproteobacteria bacterium AqS3]
MKPAAAKSSPAPVSLGRIAEHLGRPLNGSPDTLITAIAPLDAARSGQISFLASAAYRTHLPGTRASAVILTEADVQKCPCASLVSPAPYHDYARTTELFAPSRRAVAGIHPAAHVHPDAEIDPGAEVGPGAVIEAGVHLGPGVVVGPNCNLMQAVAIGADTVLHPGVTIYRDCRIGAGGIIHAGTVIGADGFGFAITGQGRHLKIEQLAAVVLGDFVEVGAGCTLDRGALQDTVIGDGVKLDSRVHIGHGTRIGPHTLIAGGATLAGSIEVGERCRIGGLASIVPGIQIAPGVEIAPTTMVTGDITEADAERAGRCFAGGATGHTDRATWRRNAAAFRSLAATLRRLRSLAED